MNRALKTGIGIPVALASLIFLVWHFMTYFENPFGERLLYSFLGFLGMSAGLMLAGLKTFSRNKGNEPFSQSKEKTKPEEEKFRNIKATTLKDFKKDDHDRFVPK